MCKYSYSNQIKLHAKFLSKSENISLNQAYQKIASNAGFQTMHEMKAVLKNKNIDERVRKAAFHYNSDIEELIFNNDLYSYLELLIESELSEKTATTNAYNFELNIELIEFLSYDENNGILTLEMHFRFIGDQDPDAVYSGSSIDAIISLILYASGNTWQIDPDKLKVISSVLDTQRLDFYE